MVNTIRFLIPLLLWSGLAGAAEFSASVDRQELYVNEHVLLTLALEDSDTRLRAEGVSPNIDLTLLTDQFELGEPRADFRFDINRSRGRSTSTVKVELFPKRSGNLTIPSFSVDGLATEPIKLRVLELPADAAEEVFARSGLIDERLYVRGQTLVYLDLYHRVELDNARLGGQVETEPRRVELHALPNQSRTEQVDGFEYQVTRTAWAISPLSSEPITLHLPDIWVETVTGRRWRLPFREERLEVEPLPPSVPADALIGRPKLDATAPATSTAGRLTSWEITLRTTTALTALPARLTFRDEADGLRIYMEPPERRIETRSDGGIESVAVYRGSVMPLEAGAFSLPTIIVPWFDPEQQRMMQSSLPGAILEVNANAAGDAVDQEITGTSESALTSRSDRELRLWQAATGVLLLSWLGALGFWWWRRPAAWRRRRDRAPVPATGDCRQRLLAALGGRTLEQGLRARERRCGIDDELRAVIDELQAHRYRGTANRKDLPPGLLQRVETVIDRLRREAAREDGAVEAPESEDPWLPEHFYTAGEGAKRLQGEPPGSAPTNDVTAAAPDLRGNPRPAPADPRS